MYQAMIDLDSTGGAILLLVYIFGGLIVAATAFLPGNGVPWRILNLVVGLGMAIWAAYVFLFGGIILIGFKILIIPALLIAKAVAATVQAHKDSRVAKAFSNPTAVAYSMPQASWAPPVAMVPQPYGAAAHGFNAPQPVSGTPTTPYYGVAAPPHAPAAPPALPPPAPAIAGPVPSSVPTPTPTFAPQPAATAALTTPARGTPGRHRAPERQADPAPHALVSPTA